MAQHLKLSEAERHEMLHRGKQPLRHNRVTWALTYLRQAGLLTSPKCGVFQITNEGRALLRESPSTVDVTTLQRYPAFHRRVRGDETPLGASKPKRDRRSLHPRG